MKRLLVTLLLVLPLWLQTGCASKSPSAAPAGASAPAPPPPERSRLGVHWDTRVDSFIHENEALDPGSRPVVFAGDSITEAFPLADFFPGIQVLNRGIIADGITPSPGMPEDTGLLNRMGPTFYHCHPSTVVLLIGTNHMPHEGEDIGLLLRNYVHLWELIQRHCPGARLVVHTVPPFGAPRPDHEMVNRRAAEFNEHLRSFARDNGLPLVDLHALLKGDDGLLRPEFTGDGVHLTREAYAVWAGALRPHLTTPEPAP